MKMGKKVLISTLPAMLAGLCTAVIAQQTGSSLLLTDTPIPGLWRPAPPQAPPGPIPSFPYWTEGDEPGGAGGAPGGGLPGGGLPLPTYLGEKIRTRRTFLGQLFRRTISIEADGRRGY